MAPNGARIPQSFTAADTANKLGLAGFTDALRHELLAWTKWRCGQTRPSRSQQNRKRDPSQPPSRPVGSG